MYLEVALQCQSTKQNKEAHNWLCIDIVFSDTTKVADAKPYMPSKRCACDRSCALDAAVEIVDPRSWP
jgi:hypothetical protein|eukprot:COSAG01_NODE_4476_length_4987_cov_1.727143_4_plen_68_part_00